MNNNNFPFGPMRPPPKKKTQRAHFIMLLSQGAEKRSEATVYAWHCAEFMEEMCFVPCARDCQLSEWTTWTECRTDARCGNGVQTRARYVVEPSLDGGRDCPTALTDGEVYCILIYIPALIDTVFTARCDAMYPRY